MTGNRYAIPVPLLPNELFSSWLVRCALLHGCNPMDWTGEIWPDWRPWTLDLDRRLCKTRIARLEEVLGIDMKGLEEHMLFSVLCKYADPKVAKQGTWSWMLPQGSRNRRRSGGLQFCPSCLKTDRRPYFRMAWRLAWHTGCSIHHTRLLDLCPHCQMVIAPHYLLAENRDLAVCATCRGDLWDTRMSAPISEALAFQEMADQALQSGWGTFGNEKIPVRDWFVLARCFVSLLRRGAMMRPERLVAFLKCLGVESNTTQSPATGLALELLPVDERARLLAGAFHLLGHGLAMVQESALAIGIHRKTFFDLLTPAPFCLEELFLALPGPIITRDRTNTSLNIVGASEPVVMRKWARLQRKLRQKGINLTPDAQLGEE